jgi:hypothetical protein
MNGEWLKDVAGVSPASTGPLESILELAESRRPEDLRGAVDKLLADASALDGVSAAMLEDQHGVEALLMRLENVRGMKGVIGRLRSLLRDKAKKILRDVGSANDVAGDESGESLRAVLGRDDLALGLRLPRGWTLDPESLAVLVLRHDGKASTVAHRAILITVRYCDIDDGATSLRLEWPTLEGWVSRVVPRATVSSAREIVSLSAWGAPVNSGNAQEVVRFLSAFEADNAAILPRRLMTRRMGWQAGEEMAFVWGRTTLRASVGDDEAKGGDFSTDDESGGGFLLCSDAGNDFLVDGFRALGSWDGWLRAADAARPYPTVWLAIYAALVPPLMPFLDSLPNFIVDFAGETSSGKTTTLRFAASVWGGPDERGDGVIRTWDSTRVYLERAAAVIGHLPLILDDSKRAAHNDAISAVVYLVTQGVGRGRGAVSGLVATAKWKTVMLSSGEASLTSYSNDGGVRARTLSLWGSPFGGADEATTAAVAGMNTLCRQHYGHLGPRLVRWILDRADAATWLRRNYDEALAGWASIADGNPVENRVAQYVAALCVAARIVHDELHVPPPDRDPMEAVRSVMYQAAADSDRALDALRVAVEWASANQHRFWAQDRREVTPASGWLGSWDRGNSWSELAFLPTPLKSHLLDLGYEADAMFRSWSDRGWLRNDNDAHKRPKVRVAELCVRCLCVRRTILVELGLI